jgi:hypothetical protein
LHTQVWNFSNSLKSFPEKSWNFLQKWSKICLSPSGYKLESWNFAWTCFTSLSFSTNLEFFEIRWSGFLKNPDIFLKNCRKCVKDLKFCMNELFNNVFKAFSFLKFREVHFGSYWKKNLLVRNMWKIYTRPTGASDFFILFNASKLKTNT